MFHENFSETLEDVDVCGVTVDAVVKGVVTDRVYLDNDGTFVRFTSTASVKNTFTAENGKSVVVSNWPVLGRRTGHRRGGRDDHVRRDVQGATGEDPDRPGAGAASDAGLISFVDTFDLETFELISSEVVIKGPHPEAERLCAVLRGDHRGPRLTWPSTGQTPGAQRRLPPRGRPAGGLPSRSLVASTASLYARPRSRSGGRCR